MNLFSISSLIEINEIQIFETTRCKENTLNQGRIPNMMCFPDLSFYDAEQRFLVISNTTKSYLTMIQIAN